MSSTSTDSVTHRSLLGSPQSYVVVARRYRPQTFDELIGQEHVAQALSNAIATNRVGHAYLFTGARGVGKTSAARILAKALNCQKGPTPVPCNECDICQSISSGEDVDVLEIDGASNRGIDEIRQLRQNAGVRPSRSRYQDLHHRRSPHAHARGIQRPAEDPRRAARACQVHLLHHRADENPDHDPLAVPAVRFCGHSDPLDPPAARADRGGGRGGSRAGGAGSPGPAGGRLDARQPIAAGATAGVFIGPNHRGRRSRDARHGRRRAAGGAR